MNDSFRAFRAEIGLFLWFYCAVLYRLLSVLFSCPLKGCFRAVRALTVLCCHSVLQSPRTGAELAYSVRAVSMLSVMPPSTELPLFSLSLFGLFEMPFGLNGARQGTTPAQKSYYTKQSTLR